MPSIDKLVETYVALRDQKGEVEQRHKAELGPLVEGLDTLEGMILQALQATGAESARTKYGTAYTQKWMKASVASWESVLSYAIDHERFDLFERRVNKTVVEEIGAVPGVSIERGIKVNVRRS